MVPFVTIALTCAMRKVNDLDHIMLIPVVSTAAL